MLSISKYGQLAAVATLVVLLGATAAPNMASAAKGDNAQAENGRRDVQKSKSHVNKSHVNKSHVNKSQRHTTTKTVVRTDRDHARSDRRHVNTRVIVRTRTTAVYVPFVVLGPSVAYASYGSGWCRGLHRGRHWAPGIGWHAGQHVGRVKCG
jgi:uncharacterized membrane protein YhiD involved in acid resistance